jgi:hypothetical protein
VRIDLDVWLGKTAAEKILLWGDPPSRTSWDFRVPQPVPLPVELAAPGQPRQVHQEVEEVAQVQQQAQTEQAQVGEVQQPVNQVADDDSRMQVEHTGVHVKRNGKENDDKKKGENPCKKPKKSGVTQCAGML